MRDYFANPEPVPTGTLVELFFDAIDASDGRPAFQRFAGSQDLEAISHDEAYGAVCCVAAGLAGMGVERGDRVGLLSENRPEWALVDYGCMCAGVEDVPIYSTLLSHQVAYIVQDSGCRVLFVSTAEQLEKALEARSDCPELEHIVVFDDVGSLPDGVTSWSAFLGHGHERSSGIADDVFRRQARQAKPEDVATLIYTSGTTGTPKGVMLTHGNLVSNVQASRMALNVGKGSTTLSFLPLSHVLQRMVDYLLFAEGCVIAYARSIKTVPEDIRVVRPTIVVSVPRLYEKIYNRVTDAGGLRGSLVRWAIRVGEAWADDVLAGRTPSRSLRARFGLADRLVFRKVREAVGGRLEMFVSGGAPLEPVINRFFFFCGLRILEGYGLTETSPVTNVNTFEDFRIGTVGKPIASTEIRIAEDGEILVRGPQVMKGYYKQPEATRAVIDPDGWFSTGDIGTLDDDGFLRITDRKKDIIVTAGGKNIAPQPVENRLKTNPFVDQAVMIGDRRKFPIVLVVPDFSVLEAWCREVGIPTSDRSAMLADERVQEKLEGEIMDHLRDLASFETPKKIGLLEHEFTIENGIMTPKQSVKRRVVEDRYAELIDAFFEEEASGRTILVAR